MEWAVLGDVSSLLQISVSLKLIYAIVNTANNARMHKKNCRQFAQHVKMIANLLEQLKPSDVNEYPEYPGTREPLEHLEQSLTKALMLVENCRDKSYLYLIAMGWSIVNQFKDYQDEIDRYLRLIPLITLVENHRDRLRAIERDRRDYTLDDEEKKMYENLIKEDRSKKDTIVLQKSLSRSYPGMGLELALQQENEKLRSELKRMQGLMDLDQCDVIEHLIEITENVKGSPLHDQDAKRSSPPPPPSLPPPPLPPPAPAPAPSPAVPIPVSVPPPPLSPQTSPAVPSHSRPSRPQVPSSRRVSSTASNGNHTAPNNSSVPYNPFRKWHNGLYDCCMDPFLCVSTFLYPCGTFTNIAAVVSDGDISQEVACHDLAFHSLFLGCYCYTCCYRRKLRKRFNIPGGTCDDFWAHCLCCWCAMVQEWREIQACEEEGLKLYKMRVPSQQTMDNYRARPSPMNPERYRG